MLVQPDTSILASFKALLNDEGSTEPDFQRFIETHTEFLYTPHLLNHRLNFNCIISKLRVGPWATDFAYLTKATLAWRLVLVELERPDKSIFKANNLHEAFTAEMNDALAQVQTWRDQWNKSNTELLEALKPLRQPPAMRDNPATLRFMLIIGRDRELQGSEARRRRLALLEEQNDLIILTYDSLVRCYEQGSGYKKCVLAPTAKGFRIKQLDGLPSGLFANVGPAQLEVSTDIEERLVAHGFDIPAWRAGRLLVMGGRQPTPIRQARNLSW